MLHSTNVTEKLVEGLGLEDCFVDVKGSFSVIECHKAIISQLSASVSTHRTNPPYVDDDEILSVSL